MDEQIRQIGERIRGLRDALADILPCIINSCPMMWSS